MKSLSCVRLLVTPWTAAYQASPWDFPGKNTGVGCHGLLQGNLPHPGIKPRSPTLQADSLPSKPPGKPHRLNAAAATKSLQSCLTLCDPIDGGHCLWDSPGKNTGVSCHFLLQCMKAKSEREVAQSCPTLHNPMGCSLPGSPIHGIFQATTQQSHC